MKKQIIASITSILVLTIIFSPMQSSEAASYVGHDGSVSEYLEKVTVKPYANKKNYWSYIVKACADEHNLGVAGIILKSDTEQIVLGVGKSIKKGNCSYYGAVMQAKDGKTLGAELIQTHEALAKQSQLLKDSKNASGSQKKSMMEEYMKLYIMTGFLPRM